MPPHSILLICEHCGTEASHPSDSATPGTCRRCRRPLPCTGAVIITTDSALNDAIASSRGCFVGVFDGRPTQHARRACCKAAAELQGRVEVCVVHPNDCPGASSRGHLSSPPSHSLWVSGKRLASIQGDTRFEDLFKWMVDTLVRFNLRSASRPLEPCLRCKGTQIIRCLPTEQGIAPGDTVDSVSVRLRRLAVTHVVGRGRPSVQQYGDGVAQTLQQDPDLTAGELEAYVCRSCGFVEWFALNPQSIPIGPEHRTELIEIPQRSPYR